MRGERAGFLQRFQLGELFLEVVRVAFGELLIAARLLLGFACETDRSLACHFWARSAWEAIQAGGGQRSVRHRRREGP